MEDGDSRGKGTVDLTEYLFKQARALFWRLAIPYSTNQVDLDNFGIYSGLEASLGILDKTPRKDEAIQQFNHIVHDILPLVSDNKVKDKVREMLRNMMEKQTMPSCIYMNETDQRMWIDALK